MSSIRWLLPIGQHTPCAGCVQEDGESVPSQYIIDIEGGAHGQLGAGHLADHPSAVTALQGALKVGSPLGPLLVLERVEVSPSPYLLGHPAFQPSVVLLGWRL